MVSPDLRDALHAAVEPQHAVGVQAQLAARGGLHRHARADNLLQFINQNQALDIDAIGGFLPRPGVPGGGFTGNYYDIDNDEFVNLKTPPAGCDLLDDPGECIIPPELRGPLLGLDEDEGANMLYLERQVVVPRAADQPAEAVQRGLHVQRQLHVLARRSTTSRTRACSRSRTTRRGRS